MYRVASAPGAISGGQSMRLIIYYDKDDHPIAEGTSAHDLARKLGITPQAVSHGLHRGSKRYGVIEDEEETNG